MKSLPNNLPLDGEVLQVIGEIAPGHAAVITALLVLLPATATSRLPVCQSPSKPGVGPLSEPLTLVASGTLKHCLKWLERRVRATHCTQCWATRWNNGLTWDGTALYVGMGWVSASTNPFFLAFSECVKKRVEEVNIESLQDTAKICWEMPPASHLKSSTKCTVRKLAYLICNNITINIKVSQSLLVLFWEAKLSCGC